MQIAERIACELVFELVIAIGQVASRGDEVRLVWRWQDRLKGVDESGLRDHCTQLQTGRPVGDSN